MSSKIQAFENIAFLYVCKNRLINKVDEDFFKNKYISKLYVLTKKFWDKFKELPFDLDSPNDEQIRELASNDVKAITVDPNMSAEDNLSSFMSNVNNIINTDLKKYSEKFLKETVG